jgi:hypothetical protein
MKKLLVFLFIIVPMGLITSPILALVLGIITACSSMAHYWTGVISIWFNENGESEPLNVWEKHLQRLDNQNELKKGSTNND